MQGNGEVFGTHFASDIIKKNTTCSLKEMRKIIIKADKKMIIKKCGEKTPMIAKVAESPGWVYKGCGITPSISDGKQCTV